MIATLEELILDYRWGVSPPEIDLDHLCDPHNLPDDGTGEWIFEDDGYKKWQSSDQPELLWLCGGPGTGKTVLAKRVSAKFLEGLSRLHGGVKFVYHFVSPEPPTDGISVDETESLRRRLSKVPWDLLYGILRQNGSLFGGLRAELEYQGYKLFTNPGSLWKILRNAVRSCGPEPVYILMDGVDGFKEGLCQLIQRIRGLMDTQKVKIFLSSRDVPHIANNLSGCTKINLDMNRFVKEDVKTFINRGVNKFESWDVDQKDRAIEALSAKSEGIFLWTSLAIENLKRFSTGPDYEEFLRKLPLGLKTVYENMLREVSSREGSEKVLQMIRNVALALRPLTFGELGHILARTEGATGQQPSRKETSTKIRPRTEMEIKQYIRFSLSFLRAGATTVSIVHHTATEYLFDESRQDGLPVLHKGEFDLRISWECFQYFHHALTDLEVFLEKDGRGCYDKSRESSSKRDCPQEPAETPQEMAQKRQQMAVARWPYLKYAAESWFIHARRSIEIAEDKFFEDSTRNWLEYQFFDTSDTIRKPWIELCGDPKMEVLAGDQTPLHVAVCLGLTPLIEKALSSFKAGPNGTNNNQSPVHLAAKSISGTYKILIAKGSPSLLTAPGQFGNTPLHEAAISGHILMLAGLVEKFATPEYRAYSGQINQQNHFGDTPLHLAVQFDHPDIVKFLVENCANLTIKNCRGVTALGLSARLGRGDSLDILMHVENIREAEKETAEETAERTAGGFGEGLT
ncbi:hypothetical protein HOY80DRAFT_1006060 [Tuber brumale]|nr:hypothetical protein HOY80DRAFT_1006060 [Tuber brumale]